ncbi:hypothetical protein ES704_02089 [subsurface metagenome]|jgi:hypothetical protein
MSAIFYNVIFKGTKGDKNESHSLTFKSIISDKPINIPSQYFSSLKILSQKRQNVINFQNIREVIKSGDVAINYNFNYYIVILYTSLLDGKKEGFLIGNVKKLGDILIGIWPFNQPNTQLTSDMILEKLDVLISSENFKNISVIYS